MAAKPQGEVGSKSIFVISPIGKCDDDGVDFTRIFLEQIVAPAAKEAGFGKVTRADQVKAPGSIIAKVVTGILDASVCVADLTERNPNVMYEVALAHAADKQVIFLQQEEGGPPFDFADQRVIRYSIRADEANRAKDDLVEALSSASHDIDDPRLASALNQVRAIFREMRARDEAEPAQQVIIDRLDMLTHEVARMRAYPREPRPLQSSPAVFDLFLNAMESTRGEDRRSTGPDLLRVIDAYRMRARSSRERYMLDRAADATQRWMDADDPVGIAEAADGLRGALQLLAEHG